MLSKKNCFYLFSLMWLVLSQIVDFSVIFDLLFKRVAHRSFIRNHQARNLASGQIRFIRGRKLQEEVRQNDRVQFCSDWKPEMATNSPAEIVRDQPANQTLPPAIDFPFTFPPTSDLYPTGASSFNGVNTVEPERVSSSDVVPAVMVAVASSVILCSVLLYAADLRDRFQHERMIEEHRRRRAETDATSSKQMETIASSGGYWVRSGERTFPQDNSNPQAPEGENPTSRHVHHHRNDQPEFVEEYSISAVSTMTGSLAPLENGLQRIDSDGIDESLDITELSETHRVSLGTDLASLVDLSKLQTAAYPSEDGDSPSRISIMALDEDEPNSVRSGQGVNDIDYKMHEDDDEEDESGWTSSVGQSDSFSDVSIGTYLKSIHSSKSTGSKSTGSSCSHAAKSRASSTNSQELYGIQCLGDSTPQTNASGDKSLGRSPDTPFSEGKAPVYLNELAQLEQVYEKAEIRVQECPHISRESFEDDSSVHQDYVRSVYFVPVATAPILDLGIQLADAVAADAYPNVLSISKESPLIDRVFVGDVILAVNNEWTAGQAASDVKTMFCKQEGDNGTDTADVVKLTIMSSRADGSDTESEASSVPESIDEEDDKIAAEV